MSRDYEWVYEPMDQYGDIIDPEFSDKLLDVIRASEEDMYSCHSFGIGLVLREGDDIEGETYREYAYVVNDRLPDEFPECSIKVPKRFHKELSKFYK